MATVDIWAAAPVLALVAGGFLLLLHNRGAPSPQLLCVAAFCVYLACVAAVTVFPIVFDRQLVHAMRADGTAITHGLNLVPFRGINVGAYSSGQVAGNLLLGVPFGFGLPFAGVRSIRAVFALGLLFAFGIEGSQLALDVAYGFAFRVVDINDVILNSLGVVVGILAFLVISAPYRWLEAGRGVGDRRSYLGDVLSGR
jgi:glycopeptide antibiotics resistance protein